MSLLNGNLNIGAHSFQTVTFSGVPSCDTCGDVMWGLRKQGMKCLYCGYATHHKCADDSPTNCTGVVVAKENKEKKKKKKKKSKKNSGDAEGSDEKETGSKKGQLGVPSLGKQSAGSLARRISIGSMLSPRNAGRDNSNSNNDAPNSAPTKTLRTSTSAGDIRRSSLEADGSDAAGSFGLGSSPGTTSTLSSSVGSAGSASSGPFSATLGRKSALSLFGRQRTSSSVDSTGSLSHTPPRLGKSVLRRNTDDVSAASVAAVASQSVSDGGGGEKSSSLEDDSLLNKRRHGVDSSDDESANETFKSTSETSKSSGVPPLQRSATMSSATFRKKQLELEFAKLKKEAGEQAEREAEAAKAKQSRTETVDTTMSELSVEDTDEFAETEGDTDDETDGTHGDATDDEDDDITDDEESDGEEEETEPKPRILWNKALQVGQDKVVALSQANGMIEAGDHDAALELLSTVEWSRARELEAKVLQQRGDIEAAMDKLKEALQLSQHELAEKTAYLRTAQELVEYQERVEARLGKQLERSERLNKKTQGQLREGLRKLNLLESKDKRKKMEQSKQFATALSQLTNTLQQFEDGTSEEAESGSSSGFQELNVKDSVEKKKKRLEMSAEQGRLLWEKLDNQAVDRGPTGLENAQYRTREEKYKMLNVETELEEIISIKGGNVADDQHIWAEPDRDLFGSCIDLVMNGNEVSHASVNRLVEHVTSPNNHEEVKVVVLNYRTFISPLKMLWKLVQRWNVPPENDAEVLEIVQHQVYEFLLVWLSDQPEDFRQDGELEHYLRMFLEEQMRDGGHETWAERLIFVLEAEASMPEPILDLAPLPDTPKNVLMPSLEWHEVKPEELARQLTIKDWESFKEVKGTEFLNLAWSKESLQHMAPNLLACIMRSNGVSNFVIKSIMEAETAKQRGKLMSLFCSLAAQLKKMHNMAAMASVVAGLNNQAVHRLKFSRKHLKRSDLSDLKKCERVMNPEGAYKSFREEVNAALASGESVIPFLGVFCSDLTFVEDGNPDTKDGLVNFHKKVLIYRIIDFVARCQRHPYNLVEVPQISRFFESSALPYELDEEETYQRSLTYEPRGAKAKDIA